MMGFLDDYKASRAETSKRFLAVRRALNRAETRDAYNLCYKKPWRFYTNHTVGEAVRILLDEAGTRKGEL